MSKEHVQRKHSLDTVFAGSKTIRNKLLEKIPGSRRQEQSKFAEFFKELDPILTAIPEYTEFKTGAELQANGRQLPIDFPHLAESGFLKVHERFGTSTEGRDIDLIEIGDEDSEKTVMWVGTPHPNEPIGTLTIEFFSRYLCEHPELAKKLDTKFVFITNADPDGLALNESWLKGEMDPFKYALGFYRPIAKEQVEWSFPIDYKTHHFHTPTKETQVLMKAMELYRPTMYYSLHNAAFRNTYFLLPYNVTALIDPLHQLVANQGLEIDVSGTEMPWQEVYSSGIYQMSMAKDYYNNGNYKTPENSKETLSFGAVSTEYLQEQIVPDALSLITEVPYFTADPLNDTSLSGLSKREAVMIGTEKAQRILNYMNEQYNGFKDKLNDSRLKRAVESHINLVNNDYAFLRKDTANEKYNEKATIAELYNKTQINSFYEAIALGQVYRLAVEAGEIERSEKIKDYIEGVIDDINNESPMKAIPIKKLVAIQVGAGLLTQQQMALAA